MYASRTAAPDAMRTSISPSSSLGLLHTDPRQVCRESSPLASLMKSDAPLQLGYGNVFGLSTDANWVGNQYSPVSTMNAIAQLAWQPFSSYLIIRVPARTLMHPLSSAGVRPRPVWQLPPREYKRRHFGRLLLTLAVLASMRSLLPDSSSVFSKLDACSSSNLLFAQWYRRSEQPLRVAAWDSTNGIATIFAAILTLGL